MPGRYESVEQGLAIRGHIARKQKSKGPAVIGTFRRVCMDMSSLYTD